MTYAQEIALQTKKTCAAASKSCPKDASSMKTRVMFGAATVVAAAACLKTIMMVAGL